MRFALSISSLKVPSHDDVMAKEAELKFLHNTCGYWDFPKVDDIQVVETKYIFIGPCTPSEITKKGYKICFNKV